MHATVKKFIMKDAEISGYDSRYVYNCYNSYLTVSSACDSLFCNVDCTTVAVFDLADQLAIITKDSCDRFYTFSFLKQVVYKKGQVIKKGAFFGLMMKSEDEDKFQLHLTIADNKNSFWSADEMWVALKQQQGD
jgi:hypothetical protein